MVRRTFLALTASSIAASTASAAAPGTLNGRWDLTVPGNDKNRAWWIEIKGADTPAPSGSFIGAPGGDLNQINDLKVATDGEATWSFARPVPPNNKNPNAKPWKAVYKAKVGADGKLTGSMTTVEGAPAPVQPFHGNRAPKFTRQDPAKLKAGKPVELFNGRDLAGWKPVRTNLPMLWKVEGGILKNAPGTIDIITEAKFMDFRLHVEYKVGPKSNSGIGLRARYEVQILEDFGQPPNTHGNGALYSRILPTSNASKPANEWQVVDITLVGNVVTIVLNGAKVIDNKEIDGLTAVAIDPNEGEPGPIILQGDHGAVEFRKVTLTPLTRA